jgi:hypothetical protein
MKYVVIEKAKPYTRTRRGKLERVKGYGQETLPLGDTNEVRNFRKVKWQLGSRKKISYCWASV